MANIYSNENFPFDMVVLLRQLGHDVLTSYDAGQANQVIPDSDVLAFATRQNRILITLNRDDFLKLHQSGISHAGIIICKEDRDYAGQVQTVNGLLIPPETLENQSIRVKKRNQPKSARPVFTFEVYKR